MGENLIPTGQNRYANKLTEQESIRVGSNTIPDLRFYSLFTVIHLIDNQHIQDEAQDPHDKTWHKFYHKVCEFYALRFDNYFDITMPHQIER